MSEDVKNQVPSAPEAQDKLENFKAEMARKLDNQNAQIQALLSQLEKKSATPVVSEAPKKISVFDDEEAYARTIEERAEKRIEEKLARKEAQTARYQQTVQSILNEYPEAGAADSALMKRATEIYGSLSDEEKSSALAMKAAVASAAAEIGLRPKSKRPVVTDTDGYSVSSSGSAKLSTPKQSDIDQRTHDLAILMGRDPESVKKFIKKG
jgi:hypothetical protein